MYGIIANCNYSDDNGNADNLAISCAAKAVECGWTDDADLVAALDTLEETLAEYADNPHIHAVNACRAAERAVLKAWTDDVQAEIEAVKTACYRD